MFATIVRRHAEEEREASCSARCSSKKQLTTNLTYGSRIPHEPDTWVTTSDNLAAVSESHPWSVCSSTLTQRWLEPRSTQYSKFEVWVAVLKLRGLRLSPPTSWLSHFYNVRTPTLDKCQRSHTCLGLKHVFIYSLMPSSPWWWWWW